MKIGELANKTGMLVETIRFYEREGLLPSPARTAGNYRIYTAQHADQLAFIRHCRSLDMALDEVRTLLTLRQAPDESCEAINRVLDEHIKHVAERIRELKALQKQLIALRAQCSSARDVAHCGILNSLCDSTTEPSPARGNRHVASTHRRRR